MNTSTSRTERSGYLLWVILAGLLVLVIAAFFYRQHRSEKLKAQAEQQEIAALAEAQRQQQRQEEEQRREEEAQLAAADERRMALETALKAIDGQMTLWEDAERVASTTGRIALSAPVTSLQTIRRDTAQLTVTTCLGPARDSLVKSMDATIEGFLAFMRNDLHMGEVLSRGYFDDASKEMAAYKQLRAICESQDG